MEHSARHTQKRLPAKGEHRKEPGGQKSARKGARSDRRRPGRPDDTVTTALALAARDGDRAAGEVWARALYRDVLAYVTHLGADPQSAADLTQDTFLRALGALHRFEARSSSRTWLLAIARHAVQDTYRRPAPVPHPGDTRTDPGFEERVTLTALLDRLPADRREAFVLTQLAGWTYEEAAARAGCPVGTIRSRVARARAALAGELN